MREYIYHITTPNEWNFAKAHGEYRSASLASEGFIHCSTAQQVEKVANAFYKGRKDLILLKIHTAKLNNPVKWEAPAHLASGTQPTTNRYELFPHIYGVINTSAVENIFKLIPDANGTFHVSDKLETTR